MTASDQDRGTVEQTGRSPTQGAVQDDEISLVDLYLTLLRRWRTMAVVFLLVFGATAAYAAYLAATAPGESEVEPPEIPAAKIQDAEQRIAKFDARLERLEEAAQGLEERLTEPPEDAGAAEIAGSVWLYERLQGQREDLESARESASEELADLTDRDPEPEPAEAESRAGLVLALGGVLGLMLAIFSAFMAEFLATAHREYRRRRDQGAI
ncbi:hypothetical protein [Halorhodospira halophila]|uniref:hypothetical protein n=1 Tax=Halorhodospira halophila TaxID=1053 RepID=UPI00191296DA|nr:hypothetical protein [Halorhodospira halophila]MBK5935278.1 hypothetical protein [Halorhodospira halophila]